MLAAIIRRRIRALSAGEGPVIPTGAIQERDGDYILDRSGNYIEVRAT